MELNSVTKGLNKTGCAIIIIGGIMRIKIVCLSAMLCLVIGTRLLAADNPPKNLQVQVERPESAVLIKIGQKLDTAQTDILLDTLLFYDARIKSWSTMNMMGAIGIKLQGVGDAEAFAAKIKCCKVIEVKNNVISIAVDPVALTDAARNAGKLIVAARKGDLEQVKGLIAAGVPVDVRDDDWETALIASAKNGHVEVVRVLLSAGADPCKDSLYVGCALCAALDYGHHEVVAAIIDAKSERTKNLSSKD